MLLKLLPVLGSVCLVGIIRMEVDYDFTNSNVKRSIELHKNEKH